MRGEEEGRAGRDDGEVLKASAARASAAVGGEQSGREQQGVKMSSPAGGEQQGAAPSLQMGGEPELSLAQLRELAQEDDMPRVQLTRRRAISGVLFVLSAVAFFYFVLPKISGVSSTVHRIERGDSWWIAAGIVLEALSFAAYVVLFQAVFVRADGDRPPRIGLRESYQITMAGVVATRLFAAAGAGGVALTAWALRRSGMEARLVACRMVAFMVLLYVIYAGSLVLAGLGLGTGLFPGGGSFAITIVPATVGALLLVLGGAVALLPQDAERRLQQWAKGSGRIAHWMARAVTVPALGASGVRTAIALVRTRDPRLLGAPAWWGFEICVLWACFHAFGQPPPFTIIWMAYFVGMLGNLLPLPGGIGGVEGGMIGALAAFGVDFNLAVLAVLSYRGISFWLPTIPGIVAYLQLRRTVARWREEPPGLEPGYTIQSKVKPNLAGVSDASQADRGRENRDGDELRWQTSRT
ncbi:MAG TPA: lysylphosphatidylglycerol synthase transmembrane domain-containing protein [Solirubrobacteraceae bacterium]